MHQLILQYYTFIVAQLMFLAFHIIKIVVMVSLLFVVWHKNIEIEHIIFQREIRILISFMYNCFTKRCAQKCQTCFFLDAFSNIISCIRFNYFNYSLFVSTMYYNLVTILVDNEVSQSLVSFDKVGLWVKVRFSKNFFVLFCVHLFQMH